MKILFFAPRYHTNYFYLIKYFKKKKIKVKFLVRNFGKLEDNFFTKPIKLKESVFSVFINLIFSKIGTNNPFYIPKISNLNSFINKFNPTHLIIRKSGRISFYLMLFIAKLKKIKIIIHDQIDLVSYFSAQSSLKNTVRKFEFFIFLFFFKCKFFTVLSRNYKKISKKKCFFLPFAYSTNKINIKKKKIIKILTIGKYIKRKNFQLLLKALSNLKNKNFILTIIGECSTSEMKNELFELKKISKNLNLKVNFFTNLPFNKMGLHYKRNDLFVLPATNEPGAVSVVEALINGLPAICSNTCGSKTYILNGKNGYLFKDNCSKNLTIQLNKAMNNKNLSLLKRNTKKINIKYLNFKQFDKILRQLLK